MSNVNFLFHSVIVLKDRTKPNSNVFVVMSYSDPMECICMKGMLYGDVLCTIINSIVFR